MQERKPQKSGINRLIRDTSARLAVGGIDTGQLEAELIWSHVLNLPRLKLLTEPNLEIDPVIIQQVDDMVARRIRREPLQHILGEAHFYGMVFKVSPEVLVPRPETELLVEQAIKFLGARAHPTIFEFGTGSGCISIAIANEIQRCRVTSVDISEEATVVARHNAKKHGVSERVEFLTGDGFKPLPADRVFDLIVSNPPYIPSDELTALQPEVRDYDPDLALDGGVDGLCFYRILAAQGKQWLKADGRIIVELGHDQAGEVAQLFESEMWIVENVLDDYSRIPRILIARPPGSLVANS